MAPPAVVGIGASLGGLEAMQILFAHLPRTVDVSFVVVQHREPLSDTPLLVDLLQSYCALPVKEPDDKEPLRPAHVYLAPPNYHLLVEPGFLALSVDEPVTYARPSVDVLFESLADSYGPRAVAVVLTSSSADGVNGACAVKRAGGAVFVQAPETAESPILPRAVLAATEVTATLDLRQLATRLADYVR